MIDGLQVDNLRMVLGDFEAIAAGHALTAQMQRLNSGWMPIAVEGPDAFKTTVTRALNGLYRIGLVEYLPGLVSVVKAGFNDGAPTASDGLPAAGWTQRPVNSSAPAPIWVLWEDGVWPGLAWIAADIAHEAAHLAANRRDPALFVDENGPEAVEEMVLAAFLKLGIQ